MRKNLKLFRVANDMNQAEFAKKIGCTKETYSAIETGRRDGRQTFWCKLQKAFDIPDADMWSYQINV